MRKNTLFFILLFGISLLCIPNTIYAQCEEGATFNSYCPSLIDYNRVAFEFCPEPGEIAQSTIIAGTMGDIFPGISTHFSSLTVYEGTSGCGTTGNIVFGPTNGDLSGITITASQPDLCLVFVFNSFFIPSCHFGFDTEIQVCSESLPLLLSPKAYLQGASVNSTIAIDGLMSDNLRADGALPLTSPYIGDPVSSTSNDVLAVTGENAIVDWVLVQIRDANNNAIVIASKAGLLQRNGTIVDPDGISPISFSVPSGDYFVVVQHRNHLGIISASPITLNTTVTEVDLSEDVTAIGGGLNSVIDLGNSIFGMPAGDFDGSGQIQILDLNGVIMNLGNAGYDDGDLDMNGQVQIIDFNLLLIPNLGRGQAFSN